MRLSSPRVLALASAVIVLAGAGALVWSRTSPPAESGTVVVYGTVPDFSLIERSGRTVTRADLLGHVSVVDFFYTRCTDSCPLQSAHLARLLAGLSEAPDLQAISITVDPDHDGRDVLAAYASRFGADPGRWLFLTGPRQDIYRLAVDGFHLAVIASGPPAAGAWAWLGPDRAWAHETTDAHAEPAAPTVIRLAHASRFAVVDRQARIRGYFDGADWSDVERLRGALEPLLPRR